MKRILNYFLLLLLTIYPHKLSLADTGVKRGDCEGANYFVIHGTPYQRSGAWFHRMDYTGYDYSHCKNYPLNYQIFDMKVLCTDVITQSMQEGSILEILWDGASKIGEAIVDSIPNSTLCSANGASRKHVEVRLIVTKGTALKCRIAMNSGKEIFTLKVKENSVPAARVVEFTDEVKSRRKKMKGCSKCIYSDKEKRYYMIRGEGLMSLATHDECTECSIGEKTPWQKRGISPQ